MLDGKHHVAWRQLLSPLWTPAAVAKQQAGLRRRFAEVLDSVADQGHCEFVQEVALLFPNVIFMDLMGLPRDDAEQFQAWETAILHSTRVDEAASASRMEAMLAVMGYFSELIAERRRSPREDMLSFVLRSQMDGQAIPDQDVLDFCLLMFMAGLDTVATQLSYNFWHLATHPDDRRRIVADPSLIPAANEELLRYYSFVTPGRKVTHDTEVAGCPIKAGQMVYLPIVSANRDPHVFADADRVLLDRAENPHIAFGAGPHRCLGSNLARAELKIAMEAWHARIPDYRLADGAEVIEHGGQVGIVSLPLVWDA
jgi:cytochrome P450